MNSKTAAAFAAAAFTLAGMALTSTPAFAGSCRDPWITQAIQEVTRRQPNGSYESGECTYTQYGGGHWNSYAELKGYVQQRLGGAPQLAPGARYYPGGGSSGSYYGGGAGVISRDGAGLITNDGGS